jgi:basic membrane protein A
MIDAGVDVILSRGDGVTLGVIQAGAMRPGVYIIGDIIDQSSLAPNTVIASCVWDIRVYIRNMVELYKAGKLENKSYLWGIKDGATYLAFNPNLKDKIPQSAMDLINKATEEIRTGKLVLPYITTEQEKPWVPAGGY